MPELAEVEFFRKRWSAGHGAKVLAVRLHEGKKVFRGCDTALLSAKADRRTAARLRDRGQADALSLQRRNAGSAFISA